MYKTIDIRSVEMEVVKEVLSYADDNSEQFIRYGISSIAFLSLVCRLSYNGAASSQAVVVIIHGGFWKQQYNIDNALIHTLAPFFVTEGFAACEVEYRRGRLDGGAGGWPMTNHDINSALIKLHEYSLSHPAIDINRVAVLGHSAGLLRRCQL